MFKLLPKSISFQEKSDLVNEQSKVFGKVNTQLRLSLVLLLIFIFAAIYLFVEPIVIAGVNLIYLHCAFTLMVLIQIRKLYFEYKFQKAILIMYLNEMEE